MVRSSFWFLLAAIFSRVLCCILGTVKWKRSTIFANLRHVDYPVDIVDKQTFYNKILQNISRHASEIIFFLDSFKKLPRDFSCYPVEQLRERFRIDERSVAVIEEMRQGGLYLNAHLGDYEACAAWLCKLGVPLKGSYVTQKPRWFDNFLRYKVRSVNGKSYAVKADTPRDYLRLIEQGELFCLVADQDCRTNSAVDCTFLGRKVKFNALPSFLLQHCPGIPVFSAWIEDAVIGGMVVRTLHAQRLFCNSENIGRVYSDWLESRIKANPAVWYGWTHRRFYSVNPEIYK